MNMYRKVRTTAGPVHDLAAFQARVAAGDFYPMVSSAVEPVTRVYECTKREAYQAIQRIVCALTPEHYAQSIIMNNGVPADEYGIVIEDNGWYVKLQINVIDGDAEVCSCHPPERELRTKGGVVPASDHKWRKS